MPSRRVRGVPLLAVAVLATAIVGLAAPRPTPAEIPTGPTPAASFRAVRLPSSSPTSTATATPTPSADPTATPPPPPATRSPAASPSAPWPRPTAQVVRHGPTGRIATRVVVPALDIDLPVIRQTTSYPACGVAMYLRVFRQPGQGGVTYLYAHARRGMFLPLLERSLVDDGASLIGLRVDVYTGDDFKFTYRIRRVLRHVRTLDAALAARGESLWLQTSEGPHGTIPKLQVVAAYVGKTRVDASAAHPVPHPYSCG